MLPRIVSEIAALGNGYRALVIDDGSDPPLQIAPGAHLMVRLPANMGLGVCTHIAFAHALRHGYAAAVRVDADGQHRVQDVPRLVAALAGADLVMGERTNQAVGGGLDGFGRRLLKRYYSLLARALTRGAISSDVNSGLFAVSPEAMRKLRSASFERFPEPEMFISAYRLGLRVTSVPVEQQRRTEGRSSLDVFASVLMFFRFNVFALGQLLRRKGL